MKRIRLLSLLVLACLLIPGIALAQSTATISSAPADTTGTPPQDASAFISEAKAAVAAENWSSALLITTKGTAWYPENPDLLCLHGYIYRKIGQYQKSVDTISLAIPLDPKPVRFANRGYGYLALGNYSAALSDADSGIALNASYPTSHGVRALALQGMGRNAEALEAIDRAIALEPGNAHYLHVKGRILAARGDCTGASAALEQSLSLDAGYVLPWPGFGSARENLAALNASCAAGTASPPATARSPLGWIAVAGLAGAVFAAGMRK